MNQQKSRFGLNLFLQFVLILLFSYMGTWHVIFLPFQSIMKLIFAFGCIYGIFRLFGGKGGVIEEFYQQFPIAIFGSFREKPIPSKTTAAEMKDKTINKEVPLEKTHPTPAFRWEQIFSFRYLRLVGIILVFSSLFSLLFKIEWELIHKILFSFLGAVILLSISEYALNKRNNTIASTCSIFSFALFQFTISLVFLYMGERDGSSLLVNPYLWLYVKLFFTIIFLFALYRYSSDFYPGVFFIIAYISPISVMTVSKLLLNDQINIFKLPLELSGCLLFLGILTAIVFWQAIQRRTWLLLSINILALNGMVLVLTPVKDYQVFITLGIIYLVHLIMSVAVSIQDQTDDFPSQIMHILFLNLITLPHILFILHSPLFDDYLREYPGVVLLAFALLTFVGYMVTQYRKVENAVTEVFLNSAIIISAVGIFIQVEGSWTAIAFLGYSCAVLWYGMNRKLFRTLLYGFLFLTVSLIKLYFVSADIFDSLSGSAAILIIGAFITILSYKFEAVKDFFQEMKEGRKEEGGDARRS